MRDVLFLHLPHIGFYMGEAGGSFIRYSLSIPHIDPESICFLDKSKDRSHTRSLKIFPNFYKLLCIRTFVL